MLIPATSAALCRIVTTRCLHHDTLLLQVVAPWNVARRVAGALGPGSAERLTPSQDTLAETVLRVKQLRLEERARAEQLQALGHVTVALQDVLLLPAAPKLAVNGVLTAVLKCGPHWYVGSSVAPLVAHYCRNRYQAMVSVDPMQPSPCMTMLVLVNILVLCIRGSHAHTLQGGELSACPTARRRARLAMGGAAPCVRAQHGAHTRPLHGRPPAQKGQAGGAGAGARRQAASATEHPHGVLSVCRVTCDVACVSRVSRVVYLMVVVHECV